MLLQIWLKGPILQFRFSGYWSIWTRACIHDSALLGFRVREAIIILDWHFSLVPGYGGRVLCRKVSTHTPCMNTNEALFRFSKLSEIYITVSEYKINTDVEIRKDKLCAYGITKNLGDRRTLHKVHCSWPSAPLHLLSMPSRQSYWLQLFTLAWMKWWLPVFLNMVEHVECTTVPAKRTQGG